MIPYAYLTFGFALLSLLGRGKRRRSSREIWAFYLWLLPAFLLLYAVDFFSTALLREAGREDFRMAFVFLWIFLLDGARRRLRKKGKDRGGIRFVASRFFLGLAIFAVFLGKPLPAGLGAILAAGVLEWLLEGLRERLKLSNLPPGLPQETLLFWTAALLFLAFWGV